MKKNFILAIDLGGTNLKIALFNLQFRLKARKVFSTQCFAKKAILIQAILDSVENILKENALDLNAVLGLGLGLPGPIDIRRGIVHFFPNIPGWKRVGLKKILERRIGLPVFIDNDANLMCLAEHKLGSARGFMNAVCLTLGTGVGGGIIIEGRLYRGVDNAAGEIGHMPINEHGSNCNCGGIACLETYIGNKRILSYAKRIFKRKISLEELSLLAKMGNKGAKDIWSEVASRLGIALCGVVNLLNPDVIVLGGGIANAGRVLFQGVRQTISSRAMSIQAKHVKILKARLGNDAGLIGAAIMVKEGVRL